MRRRRGTSSNCDGWKYCMKLIEWMYVQKCENKGKEWHSAAHNLQLLIRTNAEFIRSRVRIQALQNQDPMRIRICTEIFYIRIWKNWCQIPKDVRVYASSPAESSSKQKILQLFIIFFGTIVARLGPDPIFCIFFLRVEYVGHSSLMSPIYDFWVMSGFEPRVLP